MRRVGSGDLWTQPELRLGRDQLSPDADCVIEEVDGIGNFRTEKGWAPLNRRSEQVRVRGAESVKLEVSETRNGPLLSHLVAQLDGPHDESGELALAVRWGVNSLGSSLPGWLAVARAAGIRDLASATAALDRAAGAEPVTPATPRQRRPPASARYRYATRSPVCRCGAGSEGGAGRRPRGCPP